MARAPDASICRVLLEGLDALRVGVAVFDRDDVLVYCNEHFRYVYRSFDAVDQLIGLRFLDILRLLIDNGEIAGREVLEDPEAWIAARLEARRDARAAPVDDQLTDGRWIRVKQRAIPGHGIIGLWEDVTYEKASQIRLEEVVDSISDGFALWDQSDRLRLANKGFAGLFEGTATPERGRKFAALLGDLVSHGLLEADGGFDSRVNAWRSGHQQLAGRALIHHRDGRWYLIKEHRTKDGGVASVLIDITDLKDREQDLVMRGQTLERTVDELEMVQAKLEQQGSDLVTLAEELALAKDEVERADAGKTQFLRTISHELRTPLNAIIGFAEILKDGVLGELGHPRYTEYAKDIHESGRHLLELVNQILDLSRIEAGRYDVARVELSVGGLVSDSLRLMGKQFETANLELHCDVPEDLPPILADGQAFVQVLVNLLSNAAKFTPAGGRILIEARESDGWLALSVSDTGVGIPPDKLPLLMKPFERVDNELDRQTDGFGLGLAIAKSLLEMQGGRLEIDSVLGTGTTATMWLPYDSDASAGLSQATDSAPRRAG